MPSFVRAAITSPPAETETTSFQAETSGAVPAVMSVPAEVRPTVNASPAAMATMSLQPVTSHWPEALSPAATAVPSEFSHCFR